ncbi:hypothetical protein C8Q73DRAFT_781746 [Cubamyces lactineus]|nr:hypothetical protein C8Q73DRAFT_781746 [Cubamyces lactineus]
MPPAFTPQWGCLFVRCCVVCHTQASSTLDALELLGLGSEASAAGTNSAGLNLNEGGSGGGSTLAQRISISLSLVDVCATWGELFPPFGRGHSSVGPSASPCTFRIDYACLKDTSASLHILSVQPTRQDVLMGRGCDWLSDVWWRVGLNIHATGGSFGRPLGATSGGMPATFEDP